MVKARREELILNTFASQAPLPDGRRVGYEVVKVLAGLGYDNLSGQTKFVGVKVTHLLKMNDIFQRK
jgi:hypothetical protein